MHQKNGKRYKAFEQEIATRKTTRCVQRREQKKREKRNEKKKRKKKDKKVICHYSLKNPSPSYKLAGVPPIPKPSPLLFGVVNPNRLDVGVAGMR